MPRLLNEPSAIWAAGGCERAFRFVSGGDVNAHHRWPELRDLGQHNEALTTPVRIPCAIQRANALETLTFGFEVVVEATHHISELGRKNAGRSVSTRTET